MNRKEYTINGKKCNLLFDARLQEIYSFSPVEQTIFILDENIQKHFAEKFIGCKTIICKSREINKNQTAVNSIIDRLLEYKADKNTLLVGVGGGVITDLAGYVASIYKRGMRLGLVPTSVLAMVDAAVGGKNGINVGRFKNMIGTIYQPEFILFQYDLLEKLPLKEWINGFAEIIKHACIKDAHLFEQLIAHSLADYKNDHSLLALLIQQNVNIKMAVVIKDELEKNERKILNFGHTIGHAIENLYQLPHGHAVSIGMITACKLSEKINELPVEDTRKIKELLAMYQLPIEINVDAEKVMEIIRQDKKISDQQIQFILLDKIGKAKIKMIDLSMLHQNIQTILL